MFASAELIDWSGVGTHLAEPPQGRLAASRYPLTTEAWAAPANPTLLRIKTLPKKNTQVHTF